MHHDVPSVNKVMPSG